MKLTPKWTGRALASLMALAGVGCMWLDRIASPSEVPFAFSHKLHVDEEQLDCVSCHENADVSDEPGMPTLDGCAACHETIDREKPPERRVESLFAEGGFKALHASRLDKEQIFSHRRHVSNNLDCNSCHAVIRSDWKPDSHQHSWKHMHGRVARGGSQAGADNCALCHQDSLCITCHMVEAPQNHNNFFRLRGHGMAATMNLQNCAVCHEPASCDRCHSEVLPISHRGPWGSPKDTHCLGCHFPLVSESCIVCHKATPSHALATPLPQIPPHNPAMNCRQCHGVSAPLPHVDKGDQCTLCHI